MKNRPHNMCGECPINLAWDDMTETEQNINFNTKCSKCKVYFSALGVTELETCVACGGYTNEGHLCGECRERISW